MLFQIVSSFAEFEANQTRERISTVMTNMSENNTLKSKPPYGWRFTSKTTPWEPVPKEQAMIEYIRKLREKSQELTVSQICRHLNKLEDKGLKKASKWYESSLLRIMYYNNISVPKGDEHDKYKKNNELALVEQEDN